jgi:hypothetical protein
MLRCDGAWRKNEAVRSVYVAHVDTVQARTASLFYLPCNVRELPPIWLRQVGNDGCFTAVSELTGGDKMFVWLTS